MNHPRFTELMSCFLEGTLGREQEAELLELLQQAEVRAAFLELARLDREIAGLLAAPLPDDRMVQLVRKDIERTEAEQALGPPGAVRVPPLGNGGRARPPAHRLFSRRLRWLGGLAAAAVIMLVVLGWTVYRSGPEAAQLTQATGKVFVVGTDGWVAAQAGQVLRQGEGLVTVGTGSGAVVEYPDATQLELGADSAVNPFADLRASTGKRLFLSRGLLKVDAAPQPAGQPMILQTPHAEVLVRGTRFTLESEADATLVEVAQGAVQFTRTMDSKSIKVDQGNFAVASPALEKFSPQPLSAHSGATGVAIQVSQGRRLGHKGGVCALAFSPDGRLLASSTWSDGKMRLWPLSGTTAAEPIELAGHGGAVWSIAFSRDGKRLASGSVDKAVRLWDVSSRKSIAVVPGSDHLRAVAYSPDGQFLASAGFDSTIRLRDPLTGKELQAFPENERGGWAGVYVVAFAPDSRTLAAGVSDRTVHLRDISGATRFRQSSHSDAVRSVAFSPDGKLLASASNNEVMIWETAGGQERQRLSAAGPVAFSSDGKLLATGGAAPALWDPTTGRERAKLQGHKGDVYSLAFSPDGKLLALGGWLGIALVELPASIGPDQ